MRENGKREKVNKIDSDSDLIYRDFSGTIRITYVCMVCIPNLIFISKFILTRFFR